MASTFDITILLTTLKEIMSFLYNYTDKRKDNVVDAHKSIYTAFIKTYDYLRNRNGQYLPNIELAEAWNQASASIIKLDRGLGEMLYHKSRFWLDPETYISLNKDSEIIELNHVVDEMERLREKL